MLTTEAQNHFTKVSCSTLVFYGLMLKGTPKIVLRINLFGWNNGRKQDEIFTDCKLAVMATNHNELKMTC